MKKIKTLLLTSVITLTAFSAIVYSSCSKDRCSGVHCQNGGACSGGSCSCPSGYSGNFCEYSTIIFQNNAYTDMSVNINGTSGTVPAQGTAAFVGLAGTNANVTAYTAGTYGVVYTWTPFTDAFPTGGDPLTETFDISSDYFYLYLTNNAPYNIINLYVNNLTASGAEAVSIPYSSGPWGMGYYSAYSTTKVSVDFAGGGTYTTPTLYITSGRDATGTAIIN